MSQTTFFSVGLATGLATGGSGALSYKERVNGDAEPSLKPRKQISSQIIKSQITN